MATRSSARFCADCQPLLFDEVKYGGKAVQSPKGFTLEIMPTNLNENVQEGFNTRIKDHLSLNIFDRNDEFPNLPRLSNTALTCDCCSFLKQCLLCKDVLLAAADQGVDIENESFQIGFRLAYSWRPKCKTDTGRSDIGLDALYIYILNIDSSFSKSAAWGPGLSRGVFCVIRCAVCRSIDSKPSAEIEPCVSWLRLREPCVNNTFETTPWTWMKRILQQCNDGDAQHATCAMYTAQWLSSRPTRAGSPWMPTRLINVSEGALRLVTASSLSLPNHTDPPKYTALSYCWGIEPDSSLQLRTTAETKAERKRGIDPAQLSPVQQDAVTVTQNMGIQYLWIDSLCIIQGDEEDWLKESRRMGSIYSYAYFTIASLMPSNQASFLTPATPRISVPFRSGFPSQSTPYAPTSGSYDIVFDSVETQASGTERLTKLSPSLPPNRWVTRSWTLQEQALSRRLFLFGPSGVRFICQSCSETPLFEEDKPRSMLRMIQQLGDGTASQQEGYEKWRDFARDFSGRSCTKRNDRLPALAGFVRLFGQNMKISGEHAAGIWRGDLTSQILWRHLTPEPRHQSLDALLKYLCDGENFIVPSWSWIDRFGITFFVYDDAADDWAGLEPEYELLDDDSNGHSTFGHDIGPLPKNGSLPLLMKARVFGSPNLIRDAKVIPRKRREERPFNDLKIAIQGALLHCMMDWTTATENGMKPNMQHDLEHMRFVLIASASVNMNSSGNKTAIGLVVHPYGASTGTHDTKYVRIGVFYSDPREKGGLNLFNRNDIIRETVCLL